MNADHILIELHRLQAENAKLRAALKENGRHARRIQRARDCAGLLALWHVGHLPTDRTFAKAQGMAQRQWENGITLLRLARVCDQAGRWLHHDLTAINERLDDAVIAANAAPEAYFARGNNHMRQ